MKQTDCLFLQNTLQTWYIFEDVCTWTLKSFFEFKLFLTNSDCKAVEDSSFTWISLNNKMGEEVICEVDDLICSE